jgi:hypothetical protein
LRHSKPGLREKVTIRIDFDAGMYYFHSKSSSRWREYRDGLKILRLSRNTKHGKYGASVVVGYVCIAMTETPSVALSASHLASVRDPIGRAQASHLASVRDPIGRAQASHLASVLSAVMLLMFTSFTSSSGASCAVSFTCIMNKIRQYSYNFIHILVSESTCARECVEHALHDSWHVRTVTAYARAQPGVLGLDLTPPVSSAASLAYFSPLSPLQPGLYRGVVEGAAFSPLSPLQPDLYRSVVEGAAISSLNSNQASNVLS